MLLSVSSATDDHAFAPVPLRYCAFCGHSLLDPRLARDFSHSGKLEVMDLRLLPQIRCSRVGDCSLAVLRLNPSLVHLLLNPRLARNLRHSGKLEVSYGLATVVPDPVLKCWRLFSCGTKIESFTRSLVA